MTSTLSDITCIYGYFYPAKYTSKHTPSLSLEQQNL